MKKVELMRSNIWIASENAFSWSQLEKKRPVNFRIFNSFGNEEFSGDLNSNGIINIKPLMNGVYFLQFTFSDFSNIIHKIVKI